MSVMPLDPSAHPVGSPLWWVHRLHAELVGRMPQIDLWQRYVDGDHDTPVLDGKASRAFQRITGLAKTNLTGLIVEATAERMGVQGFRFGETPDADTDAWRIWQGSDFDAESELLIASALTTGRSFLLVEPPQGADGMPRLYAEDAGQMIVAYAAGRRSERLAALKVWVDDWTGERLATLYLPGSLHKYRAPGPVLPGDMSEPRWELRDERVAGEVNPLGEVPVFELRNRPRLDGTVRSEVADVLSDQDACNHIALNTLIAAEYGAFRQKWATGLEVPRDPDTGLPVEPFDVAVNRILINESDEPGARFGSFDATDLKPYIDLYESRVKHMAAVSQTPVSVLLGTPSNVSAEALALSVTGLVNKVHRRATHFEQPFEDAMRLAFRAIGDPRGLETMAETVWKDPEIRSWGQMADASVKLVQSGVVARQTAQEKFLGMSDTERARDEAWQSENDALGGFAAMLNGQAADLPDDVA